ncbi:unnamed protein product (macronuclear) [Paramecium tetraurelia]|uniref:F-box domain-containing protein n=1 Tax=Paramecium tetraurelia TaxID=5888 RepID=A0C1K1_PARTE|nr:uncharacterized protein GSPATT00034145001 [Paramecium tetraurelia]CAK64668.1 unnamed protein product [Paramecium tetraurelia]|eukprot:XP_001432065.1 hypothetical protein (macronuclear) [Paramecium tetraurelia strain d4-2]
MQQNKTTFLSLPINTLFKILSFLPIRDIYKRIARLNKKANNIVQQSGFIQSLQRLYFGSSIQNISLSQAKQVELPFIGYETDGHCPNPEQWIDLLFMKTSNSQIKLQNCNYIKGCLSKKNKEFKKKVLEFLGLVKKYLPPNTYEKQKFYEVQIAKIYEISHELSQKVINIASQEEKTYATDIMSFFWNRIRQNQQLIQRRDLQVPLQPDFQGIIKVIKIGIEKNYTKMAKVILISTNEVKDISNKSVLRTNMPEYKLVAKQYSTREQFKFGYCIFEKNQGVVALIDLKDETQIELKFYNHETQIVSTLSVFILDFKQSNEGQLGQAFQYIVASGYLLVQ